MTDPSRPTDKPGAPRVRPSPTLDLEATEIPGGATASASAGSVEQAAAGKARADAAQGEAAASSSSAQSGASGKGAGARRPPRSSWRRLAAVAALAAIILAFIAGGVWFSQPNPQQKELAAFAVRLDASEAELRRLSSRPQQSPIDPQQISDLGNRLAAAEKELKRLDEISEKLAKTEQALSRLNDLSSRGAAGDQSSAAIAGISERLSKLEKAVAAAPAPDPVASERVEAAESAVRSLSGRVSELGQRIDNLAAVATDASRQAASNEQLATQAAGADSALRFAFAATALSAAIDRGTPFATELGVVKHYVADKTLLAPLDTAAAGGIASVERLSRDISALAPVMLAALTPARDGDIFERLQASAERLVRVRPVNEAAGDDPESVVARIEAKTRRGDLAGALADFDKLPERARAPAKDWIDRAKTRVAAFAASQRLTELAVGALGKSSP